jgi:Zn-dependent alcohol dehydrogenase
MDPVLSRQDKHIVRVRNDSKPYALMADAGLETNSSTIRNTKQERQQNANNRTKTMKMASSICPFGLYAAKVTRRMPNIFDSFRLDNKIALITGAATGLGAAIAEALADAGATVAVHGNRRAATETAEAIGEKAAAFRADLSSKTGADELFAQVKEKFGRVDILINNAGTIIRHNADEYPSG